MKKPARYEEWPELVRTLFDQATEGSKDACNALLAMAKNEDGDPTEIIHAVDAVSELGGPEFQAILRRKLRQALGTDGRRLVEIIVKRLQDPGLGEDERKVLERLLRETPSPSTKA